MRRSKNALFSATAPSTLLAIVSSLLIGSSLAQNVLKSVRVFSEPDLVGAQSATLGLVFSSPVNVPSGSKIVVTLPPQARLGEGSDIPCQIKGVIDLADLCATNGPREIAFLIPSGATLYAQSVSTMIFRGVFYPPDNSEPTDPFKVKIIDTATGSILVADNNDIILSDLVANKIQKVTVSQVNSVVVSKPTAVYFTVTSLNPIPASGGIQLRLPKWNPLAAQFVRESFIVDEQTFKKEALATELPQGSESNTKSNEDEKAIDYARMCSPKRGVSAKVSCSLFSTASYDYITLTNLFSQTREAGDSFQFYVSRLRNPISQSKVPIEVLTFTSVSEVTPEGQSFFKGEIDRGEAFFEAQESAPMDPSSASVTAENSTVQEFSTFVVTFKVPVPVEEGCIVTIQLPDEFKLSSGNLNRVKGWGIFGGSQELNFGIDESSRVIKIVNQCARYSGADMSTGLEIHMLQNPSVVMTTKSFTIYVQDKFTKGIAVVNADVLYKTTPGKVVGVDLFSLGGTKIEELVDLRLNFTPQHAVSGVSALLIKLPDQVTFSCSLAYTIGLKTAPACDQVGPNLFRFNRPFNGDDYAGNLPLSLAFRNRVLPGANLMIKGISIQMLATIDKTDYLVDEFVNPNLEFFAPEQQLFLISQVSTGSEEVYTETTFTFNHTLANFVPRNAVIEVTIPPQIEVRNAEAVTSSCVAIKNLKDTLICTLQRHADNSHVLTVREAFHDLGLSRNKNFVLQIGKGLFTPLSMKTSDSFQVVIIDALGHEINYVKKALSLTVKQGKDVGPVQLNTGSGVNGDFTYHEIAFNTPAPIYNNFLLIVEIPEECQPPMEQHFDCSVMYPLSAEKTRCRINGQRITIVVALAETYPDTRIKIGEQIGFKFQLIQNPPSTQPTSPYHIEIKTEAYQIVATQRTPGARIVNTTPAKITTFGFAPLDKRQLAVTTITLAWINAQKYPKDLAIVIRYNPEEVEPVLEPGKRSVPCVFRQTVIVTCWYAQPGVIKVSDLLLADQNPGLQLQLTLTRQKIKVVKPSTIQSWSIVTYTDQSTAFAIDQIEGGLTFSFSCNLPCLSCRDDDPNYCLSCNQYADGYLINYQGKCSLDCPPETFKEAYKCKKCDAKCKTCAQNSGSTCTSCHGGFSEFPFLYGNTCVNECVFGFYGNRMNADCRQCKEPCETCSENADQCLSCIKPPPGQPIKHFYFENKCLDKCPVGWIADVPTRSNLCERCSDNCATCFGTKNQCSTCKPGLKLNTLDQTCVPECPQGNTVLQMDPLRGQVCLPCDSKCVTCSGSPSFCTSCQSNLSLLRSSGECKLECDESRLTQVSLAGQCVGCSSSCATCQHTQDNCLSCVPGTFFYANQCVSECPIKDGYKYVPNALGICHIPGIRCPFGYELTPTGNGCALMAQICLEPNKLNYDKTTCVPGSNAYVPFPMLSCCLLMTIFVALVRCKHPKSRFVANLIVLWSLIEFCGMWVLFILAIRFGIAPVVYMFLVAIMFSIATNLFFFVVFNKQVLNDVTFFHWVGYNKCTVRTITVVGIICNFKVYRLLYSNFFGAPRFNAEFRDPYKFFQPLSLASFINLCLVMLICCIACVFGIYYVAWGYQLLIECIEFLIIELLMIILYIVEHCQLKTDHAKAVWKGDAKQVDRMKVNAGFEDNLSEDDQDPDAYMVHEGPNKARKELKPKALKTIHTMEKVLAQLLVKKNAIEGGFENTVQEIEKLHERELMLRYRRRCMSFRLDRPDFRQAWGFDSDEEDGAGQNFISEPGSPRSKEMLHNPLFVRRMHALTSAYQMRDQYDNCYAEAKDPSVWPLTNALQANKKLQTNVLEMLGVDDLVMDTQTQETEEQEKTVEEYEYDPQQTAFLIDGVIERLDSAEEDNNFLSNEPLRARRDSDPSAEHFSTTRRPPLASKVAPPPAQQRSGKDKQKRKQLTKRRLAEMPDFEIEELLGEFEVGADGSNIILQTADGKLNDKYGRLVNRRGYLIDPEGNVVTRGNVFIFYKEEIDFDDEIPAPFSFQKAVRQTKFTVQSFNAHRRMRRKDKLAMQDEFIEREYQKLKQAAKSRAGDVRSQQYSKAEIMGVNPSTRMQANQSSLNPKQLSSSQQRNMNSSGVALLTGSDHSQNFGDVNLSNIILQERMQGDFLPQDEDQFNAERFMAQNATQVRRKPPKDHISRPASDKKEKGIDDEFINQVTQPMRAKTKNELLGTSGFEAASSSRMSHRSRSRSRSNDKSRKSSKKQRQQYRIRDGKLFNELSNRSFDKHSDQQASNAEIMALATAGGDADHEEELRDLKFDSRQKLNTSSSANIRVKSKSHSQSHHSMRTSSNKMLYDREHQVVNQRQRNVVNDEAYIQKVQKFNEFLERKKTSQAREHQVAARDQTRAAAQVIIDDTFLNADGSVRNVGLAHKNLNSVYGRVRSKFNEQIRQGSAALKFRPQGSSYRNRVDEPRRIIAGMSYNQRERMLQMQINNLIENEDDDFSLASLQKKLNLAEMENVDAYSSPSGCHANQRRNRDRDEKMQALKNIYSEYRLDRGSAPKFQYRGLSPRSHLNQQVVFNASKILEAQEAGSVVAVKVDSDSLKVQEQVSEAKALIDLKPSHKSQDGQTNRQLRVQSSSNKRTSTPHNILEGKYL